jgi:hypothetical protein
MSCSECSCRKCTQSENCNMCDCDVCENGKEAKYDCLDYKNH